MTVFSILYASKSSIAPHEQEGVVAGLVDAARLRNQHAGVTGCLILGSGRFAQVLEGERDAVVAIMESIRRDPRHTEITMLQSGFQEARRFAGWKLGYAGPSFFVQRTIATPVSEAFRGSPRGVADLLRIMTNFHAEQSIDQG